MIICLNMQKEKPIMIMTMISFARPFSDKNRTNQLTWGRESVCNLCNICAYVHKSQKVQNKYILFYTLEQRKREKKQKTSDKNTRSTTIAPPGTTKPRDKEWARKRTVNKRRKCYTKKEKSTLPSRTRKKSTRALFMFSLFLCVIFFSLDK